MKTLVILLAAAALVLAGCGDDAEPTPAGSGPATTEPAVADAPKKDGAAAERDDGEASTEDGAATITTGDSQFGEMLYNADKQAIYVFEIDRPDKSVCSGECAEAWPPVLTEGKPKADGNVDESLLGTIERDDGTTQVTYDRQPLYYYAHEGPGVVLCHDVFRDGGEWWVVGPDGKHL